jgi:nucleotidyltransferase/DNA polymerase involved in DNA repair
VRIACVLITHFRARVEMRRQPHLRARPAVIADRSAGKPRVADAFPAAAGVVAGMTLDEALSRHPDATVLEADEPAYRREFRQALAALQRVSDRVEGAEPGTAYAGLDGLEPLHGGEKALVRACARRSPADLAPRIGVAEAKFPAFVAAHLSKAHEAVTVPADPVPFLAPHPIDLLSLSRDALGGLLRFGLHTMGAVAATPLEPLDRYREWYGRDSVYVELQQNLLQGDTTRNRALAEIAREAGAPLVATNDVRYHDPERYRLQHALAAARRNTTIDRALRMLQRADADSPWREILFTAQETADGTVQIVLAVSSFSDFALVTGEPRLQVLPLHAGWNVVIWDGADGAGIAGALGDVAGQVDVIYQWVAETQTWRSHRPGAPAVLSAFDTFEAGASYWIAVAEAIDWTVPLAPPWGRGPRPGDDPTLLFDQGREKGFEPATLGLASSRASARSAGLRPRRRGQSPPGSSYPMFSAAPISRSRCRRRR